MAAATAGSRMRKSVPAVDSPAGGRGAAWGSRWARIGWGLGGRGGAGLAEGGGGRVGTTTGRGAGGGVGVGVGRAEGVGTGVAVGLGDDEGGGGGGGPGWHLPGVIPASRRSRASSRGSLMTISMPRMRMTSSGAQLTRPTTISQMSGTRASSTGIRSVPKEQRTTMPVPPG